MINIIWLVFPILQKTIQKLCNAIDNAYYKDGYENLFWDDVVNNNLDKLILKIHPVNEKMIVEIDTVQELEAINNEVLNGSRKIS